jgi:hypothetical protein
MRTHRTTYILLLGAILSLVFAGCGESPPVEPSVSPPVEPAVSKPTKAEWRAKLASHYGRIATMNVINNWKPSEFKQFMGEPSQTQTIGNDALWYYECSDGTIQLVMRSQTLAVGLMQGNINDY